MIWLTIDGHAPKRRQTLNGTPHFMRTFRPVTLLKLSLLSACLHLPQPAMAQEAGPATQPPSLLTMGVSPEMERLAPMAGTWRAEVELYRPRLNRWDKLESITAHFVRRYDGHYVETELVMATGTQGYVAHIAFSWDRIRREYRAFFRENVIGLIDVFEGNFEGDTLAIDNRNTGTAGPNMAGTVEPNRMRLRFESRDRFTLNIDAWRNERWVEGMRYTFSRVSVGGS